MGQGATAPRNIDADSILKRGRRALVGGEHQVAFGTRLFCAGEELRGFPKHGRPASPRQFGDVPWQGEQPTRPRSCSPATGWHPGLGPILGTRSSAVRIRQGRKNAHAAQSPTKQSACAIKAAQSMHFFQEFLFTKSKVSDKYPRLHPGRSQFPLSNAGRERQSRVTSPAIPPSYNRTRACFPLCRVPYFFSAWLARLL